MEIPWVQDPRREGSDCWGFLTSLNQGSLERFVADIEARKKVQKDCEIAFERAQSWEEKEKILYAFDFFCEEDIRNHVWEGDEDDVIELSTDWKSMIMPKNY